MDAGAQQTIKRRAACDECRTKKLKCTGEQPACSRCVREGISCAYSPQKQMGRPKKRRRSEEGAEVDGEVRMNDAIVEGQRVWDPRKPTTPDAPLEDFIGDEIRMEDLPWPSSDFGGPLPPALTPDDGTSPITTTPPLLNLPPELQQLHENIPPGLLNTQTRYTDPSTFLLLNQPTSKDPSANPLCPLTSPLPSCACLSTIYLTLSTLQTLDPAQTPFPFSLHPLREALASASQILACPICPEKFISAMQNTQLIGTLLITIAERFGKILTAISEEAKRAEERGETKKFRLADLNTRTGHLHANGIGCAAAFSVELEAGEWRGLAKKVVRAEVYGPGCGSGSEWEIEGHGVCVFLLGVVGQMRRRQVGWHCKPYPEDFPRDAITGVPLGGKHMPKEDHICLKYGEYARKLVDGFDWS